MYKLYYKVNYIINYNNFIEEIVFKNTIKFLFILVLLKEIK
jgi:hypothetical protein